MPHGDARRCERPQETSRSACGGPEPDRATRVALAIISRLGVLGSGLLFVSCNYTGLLGGLNGLNSLNSLSGLNSYVRNVGGSTSNNYSCNSVSRDVCEASVRSQRYGNLCISSSVNSVGEGQENSAVSGNCSASPSELVGLSAEDTTGNSLVSGKGQTLRSVNSESSSFLCHAVSNDLNS